MLLFPNFPALPEFSCILVCFNSLFNSPRSWHCWWCLISPKTRLLQLLARSPSCSTWKSPPGRARKRPGEEQHLPGFSGIQNPGAARVMVTAWCGGAAEHKSQQFPISQGCSPPPSPVPAEPSTPISGDGAEPPSPGADFPSALPCSDCSLLKAVPAWLQGFGGAIPSNCLE